MYCNLTLMTPMTQMLTSQDFISNLVIFVLESTLRYANNGPLVQQLGIIISLNKLKKIS